MKDYERECEGFSFRVPDRFSFPVDVFDKWGERKALFWTDGAVDRSYTFDQLKRLSCKGAGALGKLGIKRGDKVLVMVPAIPEWWELMLALMRLNAVAIPATTLLKSKDIEYRLSAVDVKAVIATDTEAQEVENAINASSKNSILIVVGERMGWHNYIRERDGADASQGERAPSNEPALVYFTSGTTGPPKMVMHTHASYPLAHLLTGKYWLDLRDGDVHWNLSDTGWAKAAWSSLFGPWHMGATIFSFYRRGKFDPLMPLEIMEKYPITTFCGPPTAYRMMVKEHVFPQKPPSWSMRHFVAAGEPLNREIIETWKDGTGRHIFDGYGQTETVNTLANFRCLPVKPGSMGMPVPGFTIDVVGGNGERLPVGTEGDLAIKIRPERPVGLFKEYLANPGATQNAMRGNWYITGDRAYRDEDGYFWFVGRADDVILTSGYRIGPFEIESVLIEHPAVKESAVVASPDETRGEAVKAFVVLMNNYIPSETLAKELEDFVKMRTAPYKYPRKIEFVDNLPKTVSGKIKRKELKMREFGK